jgi:crossover junction endodeoxyribonuclease RusA
MTVTLPWFYPNLSPNDRAHWAVKAKNFAAYKNACAWESRAQGIGPWVRTGPVLISITFCPPDRRRRDLDNMVSSSKALGDGLALALGVDDSRFVPTYRMGEPRKGGAVLVEVG